MIIFEQNRTMALIVIFFTRVLGACNFSGRPPQPFAKPRSLAYTENQFRTRDSPRSPGRRKAFPAGLLCFFWG